MDEDFEFEDTEDSEDEHEHDECRDKYNEARALVAQAMQLMVAAPCTAGTYGALFPTKWIVVAEHADEEMGRWIFTLESLNVEPWDRAGMLTHVLS